MDRFWAAPPVSRYALSCTVHFAQVPHKPDLNTADMSSERWLLPCLLSLPSAMGALSVFRGCSFTCPLYSNFHYLSFGGSSHHFWWVGVVSPSYSTCTLVSSCCCTFMVMAMLTFVLQCGHTVLVWNSILPGLVSPEIFSAILFLSLALS